MADQDYKEFGGSQVDIDSRLYNMRKVQATRESAADPTTTHGMTVEPLKTTSESGAAVMSVASNCALLSAVATVVLFVF